MFKLDEPLIEIKAEVVYPTNERLNLIGLILAPSRVKNQFFLRPCTIVYPNFGEANHSPQTRKRFVVIEISRHGPGDYRRRRIRVKPGGIQEIKPDRKPATAQTPLSEGMLWAGRVNALELEWAFKPMVIEGDGTDTVAIDVPAGFYPAMQQHYKEQVEKLYCKVTWQPDIEVVMEGRFTHLPTGQYLKWEMRRHIRSYEV